MRKLVFPAFILMTAGFLAAGCARHIEKVRAVEGDLGVPYEELGTLEVKTSAKTCFLTPLTAGTAEVVTFGRIDTPTQAERYKKKLRKILAKKAHDRYGAQQVIKVQYWPDPASGNFPDGTISARGTMIKYKSYPDSPQTVTVE